MVEVEQTLNIMSFRAEPRGEYQYNCRCPELPVLLMLVFMRAGKLEVEIVPCDQRGRPTLELDDVFIDSPDVRPVPDGAS